MTKDPIVFLRHILESIEWIESYVKNLSQEAFLNSLKDQDAVVRRLEIIGEAVKNLPEDFKNQHPEVPWKKIAGMRDNLIHEYFNVDEELVWNTLQDDLPKFKEQVKQMLVIK